MCTVTAPSGRAAQAQERSAQVTSSTIRLKAMRDAIDDGPLTLVSEERDSLLKDLNSFIDVS